MTQRIDLASALAQRSQFDRALALLDTQTDPDSLLIHAQIQFARGHWHDAMDQVNELDSDAGHLWTAWQWLWDGHINTARAHLNQISPDTEAVQARFELAIQTGDLAEATQLADQLPPPVQTQWGHARVALARGDIDTAKTLHQSLAITSPDHANHIGALINQWLGFERDAVAAFESIDKSGELRRFRLEGLASFGQISRSELSLGEQQLGRLVKAQIDHALNDAQAALATQLANAYLTARPDAIQALGWLGQALAAQGLYQKSLDAYLALADQQAFTLAQARTASTVADNLQAFDLVAQWLGPHAEQLDAAGKHQLLRAWIEMEQFAPAEHWIRRAVVRSPDDPSLYLIWGEISEGTGDVVGAISKYRQALRLQPDYAPAILAWALASELRGETNAAVERMKGC